MNKCWICCQEINDFFLLPLEDEYVGQDISIFKNTFIVKDIHPFKFCYYTCCNYCIEQYLKYHGRFFNILRKREIGIH